MLSSDQLTRSNINGAINEDNRYFYDDAGNFAEWHQGVGGGVTNYHDYIGDNTNFTTTITKGTSPNPTGSFLTMTRDAAGNLVSWADATTGQSETLTWDHENRVVKVVQQTGNKEWNMTYDGFNRMATVEEKSNGSTVSHRHLISPPKGSAYNLNATAIPTVNPAASPMQPSLPARLIFLTANGVITAKGVRRHEKTINT